jgi:hypothetical protein
MEAAQDFKIKAMNFQDCALKVSAIYDKLRIEKTLVKPDEGQKVTICKELSKQYQDILENYPNHEHIDYKIFRSEHAEYFELSKWAVFKTKARYYLQVKLLYHSLIVIPPTVMIISIIKTST